MKISVKLLYQETYTKYKKYFSRYKKSIESGRFQEYSLRRKNTIVRRIKKLKARLERLSLQLKIAATSGALMLSIGAMEANGQQLGPFSREPGLNPFPEALSTYGEENPAFVDIDGDGDLDLFLGLSNGSFAFLRNIGDVNNPRFEEQSGANNPLDGITTGYNHAAPVFVDLDNDGDFDMISGQNYQYLFSPFNNVRYFENTGDAMNPAFTSSSFPNPIDNIFSDKYFSHPIFVDIDGDGDLDVFVGGNRDQNYFNYSRENITQWMNTDLDDGILGNSPDFVRVDSASNALLFFNNNINVNRTTPTFVDLDGDGDQDVVVGTAYGNLRFLINEGSPTSANFVQEATASMNPFDGIDVNYNASPEFADLDGDGDFDMLVGNGPNESLRYYKNTGDSNNPVFEEQFGLDNPFVGFQIGYAITPEFVDLDGDGDLDAAIGGKYSNGTDVGVLQYYENIGGGKFDLKSAAETPFTGFPTTNHQNASFADMDDDDDLDLILDLEDEILYFENTGDINNPAFGAGNNGFIIPEQNTPFEDRFKTDIVDFDGDGDFDLFVGQLSYTYLQDNLKYYENNGDEPVPDFTSSIPVVFPELTGLNIGLPVPEFVDIDHDGDEDLFIGDSNGNLNFFPRTPSGFDASRNPLANPFDRLSVGFNAAPAFADIDEDGDLDAFVGGEFGDIEYFENQNEAPRADLSLTSFNYIENQGPVVIDPSLRLRDDTNDDIIKAEIIITDNYEQGADILAFTDQFGITSTFDAANGLLRLEGYATLAEYQAALRTVTYENISENPLLTPKKIEFYVNDFDNTDPQLSGVTADNISIPVTAINDSPLVTASQNVVTFTEGEGAVAIDPGLLIQDVDNTELTSASITITEGFERSDFLDFTDQNGIVGDYDLFTGRLTLSGTASVADYQTALRSVLFRNVSSVPSPNDRSVSFVVNDGQASSNIAFGIVQVVPVNTPPIISSDNFGSLTYMQNAMPIVIDDEISVFDNDNNDLESVRISVIGYIQGDVLDVTEPTSLTKTFDSQTGILTLTGPAVFSDYITALVTASFSSTNGAGTRQIEFIANDGELDSSPYTRQILLVNEGGNEPPQVTPSPQTTQIGSIININLEDIITDPDNNFEDLSINVLSIASGAPTSISGNILTIDYSGLTFEGRDDIVLEACDPLGACDENTIEVTVQPEGGPIEVFNALSPNGDGANEFLEILNITQPNTVEIFNRWGDLVYEVSNYDNATVRFEGRSNRGSSEDLSAGTYFYSIKTEDQTVTGYLVLKK